MKIAQRLSSLLVAVSLVVAVEQGTGEFIDDSVITAKVKSSLYADPEVKGSEIQVETFKGEVQLSGFVAEAGDAQKAVQIARGVKGVTAVRNDIRVK